MRNRPPRAIVDALVTSIAVMLIDDLATRLTAMGFRRDGHAEFSMAGRALRVTEHGAEVLVLEKHWVDAAVVAGVVYGTGPARYTAEEAALGAARLPARQPSTRDLDRRHLVDAGPRDEPGELTIRVVHNYFDESMFVETWDSISSDRDAVWRSAPTAAEAVTFARALWFAAGGELAPEPVQLGQITLLPMFGDRCELRVLESLAHPKLVGRPCLLDLDLLGALHTTLRHLPALVEADSE